MLIQKVSADRLNPAAYNPRRDLKPGDKDYEKLRRSIEEFGFVEPVVWNRRTGFVVGGHQRLKVLLDMGETEIDCVVVDLEPEKEKTAGLNPAALILLLALLGGGGVFAYLKLVKNKPKTKGNDSLDDYDYGEEDSEEWETEDEEVLEDGFEGSDPNEERDRAD